MAGHAQLKFVMAECSKTQIRLKGPKFRKESEPLVLFQIAGNWETAELDDRQWAILDFAMDVLNCRPITDEKIASLEKYGLSKDDAWDIGSAVAYMCLVNRMVIMLNVKPNDDFYTLGRTPKGPK